MIFCFFLFAVDLLSATHKGTKVFYRQNPPAVASVSGTIKEGESRNQAEKYIAQLGQSTDVSSGGTTKGQFTITGSKVVDGGMLLECFNREGKKYKMFIAEKKGLADVSIVSLRFFEQLLNDKENIFQDQIATIEAHVSPHRDRLNQQQKDIDGLIKGELRNANEKAEKARNFFLGSENKITRILKYIEEYLKVISRHDALECLYVFNRKELLKSGDMLREINNKLIHFGYKVLEYDDEYGSDKKHVLKEVDQSVGVPVLGAKVIF